MASLAGWMTSLSRIPIKREIEKVGITLYKPNLKARRILVRLIGQGAAAVDVRRLPPVCRVLAAAEALELSHKAFMT
ncbi:hypothetical protein [Pseudomonas sp. CP4]|uniref:hypothetical protein n=1 Tax=Pseudomonas sp. CP4 TaxID=3388844 RepID=UPI0039EF50B6